PPTLIPALRTISLKCSKLSASS
ncbi:tRNA synthetases class I (C) catalytic domain protein, partial [Chlamydia psittaci 84-8471/1]